MSPHRDKLSLPPKSVLLTREEFMQRFLISCAVGLGLLFGSFAPTPASAYYHRYYHHRYYHPYYHHHYYHHHYYHHRYRY